MAGVRPPDSLEMAQIGGWQDEPVEVFGLIANLRLVSLRWSVCRPIGGLFQITRSHLSSRYDNLLAVFFFG